MGSEKIMLRKMGLVIALAFVLLLTVSSASASDVNLNDGTLDEIDLDVEPSNDLKISEDISSSDLSNLQDSGTIGDSGDSIVLGNASSDVSVASQNSSAVNKSASQVTASVKKSKTKIKLAKNKKGFMTTSNFIKATLLDSKGKAVKNKNVLFTINKKTYAAKTDSKGLAKIKTPYKKGIFTIKFRFKGDKSYFASSANAKLNINRMITRLSAPKVSAYVTRNVYLKIKLINAKGKALAKKRLYVKISGKTYKLTTNRLGITKLKVKKGVGTYNCRITFKANKKFHGSSLDTKVIFKKLPTTLKAPSVNFKSTDYANLKINLKDKLGNALKSKSIKVNVTELNKIFTLKTDSKGVATFKFNGDKSYNLVVKFLGEKNYNPTSVKAKLNITPVKVKFADIVAASIAVMDSVNMNHTLPSTVKVNNNTFTIPQVSYLAARAVKNICNDRTDDVVLISVPKDYSISGEIYDTVLKANFSGIADAVVGDAYNFKNKEFVEYSVYHVPFDVYTVSFARIVNFYNNNGVLPNYCLFTSIDFITIPESDKYTFYLTADNIRNKSSDLAMLKSLRDTLTSIGYNAYIVGIGPDINNVAYKYGCKGDNSVLFCTFGGVDVGCIEIWAGEIIDPFVDNYAGAHVLGLWFAEPYGKAADIHGYVPQAWDADYGWALDDPSQYMDEHNISYIEVGTVEEACEALRNGDMGGPQLLPKNDLISNDEEG